MASSIVEDLRSLGLGADRFNANSQLLADGWGWCVACSVGLTKGNGLGRALVGFGEGKTELEVLTSLSDLTNGTAKAFCEVGTNPRSSRGAGAIISFDPYAAVGRFMMGGLDLDKNVMESSDRIAREFAQTVQRHNCA